MAVPFLVPCLPSLQVVRETVKKSLEAEHLKKFTAVSRQIESLQRAELENLRKQLVEERERVVRDIKESMVDERERVVRDIKESHRLELQELERKYKGDSAETVAANHRCLPKTKASTEQFLKL